MLQQLQQLSCPNSQIDYLNHVTYQNQQIFNMATKEQVNGLTPAVAAGKIKGLRPSSLELCVRDSRASNKQVEVPELKDFHPEANFQSYNSSEITPFIYPQSHNQQN